ncbi:DHA3 family multidrug efflux protein-like MFS transporter [Promicromonospora sp. AC04]|uniref:MFS transporter n=1 Tax=Promicromonospora sp. AC04 TaxID=2135723 RepID=UPI000D3A9665|nr:MFS transporter [Promicromonospora sp. AC04]PUB32236.1 DHA3 family multidrug efflux protein-like MFS transporter [Promicromonospora sp. AC04]
MSTNETHTASDGAGRLRLQDPEVRTFAHLLVNTSLVSVTNFTAWFAVTFWVYLETGSVFAAGVISGIFLVSMVGTGVWFGSLVDHHRKKTVMQVSAVVSLGFYLAALGLYVATPAAVFTDPTSVQLWALVLLVMAGVMAGNPRSIAMTTVVTALFDDGRRDKANGLAGTTSGISHLVTSVISGLLVASSGMLGVLVLAVVVLAAAVGHLHRLRVPESLAEAAAADEPKKVDLRGTIRLVGSIPGMWALIGFTLLNNFLAGGLMALADPYGLSLMSVQAWGLAWGLISVFMILGGLVVAKRGVGRNPVRTLLVVNLVMWGATFLLPVQHSVVLLVAGFAVYLFVMPFAEASEQTVLQKVVPYERQGRVLGFAHSVEMVAAPLTAFLISPLTEFVFQPFMTDGAGADLIGGWFGTGPARGIALVLMLLAVLGLGLTAAALASRQYRAMSRRYLDGAAAPDSGAAPVVDEVPVAGAVVGQREPALAGAPA